MVDFPASYVSLQEGMVWNIYNNISLIFKSTIVPLFFVAWSFFAWLFRWEVVGISTAEFHMAGSASVVKTDRGVNGIGY